MERSHNSDSIAQNIQLSSWKSIRKMQNRSAESPEQAYRHQHGKQLPFFPLIFLYLAVVMVFVYLTFSSWNYDDAFITYRYARNLASGLGFVYNPGMRVLSTTTPLFTFFLATISFIWDDLPRVANVLGVLGIGLGTFFLWDLCQQKGLKIAGYACLALYPTFPLLVTTIGLETPMYIAFCLGSIAFYEHRRYSTAAVLAALACLTRPDGLLVPILLTSHFLYTEKRFPPAKPALVFIALTLPWLLFTVFYFDSPIPVALITKHNQGAMLISERFSPGLLTVLKPYSRNFLYIIELFFCLVGGVFILLRHRRSWTLVFSWTALYFLTYAILGVSRYPWYYAPLVPTFILLIGMGLTALSQLQIHFFQRKYQSLPHAMAILVLALLGVGQIIHMRQISEHPDKRRAIYQAVGEWLYENTGSDDMVGTLEVGIIGYLSHRPMLDFAGLLQPEVGTRLGRDTSYEDAALWASEKFQPHYLVLHHGLFPSLEASFVAHNCWLVKQFNGQRYGYSRNLDIFKCGFPEK